METNEVVTNKVETKVCKICKRELPIDAFNRHGVSKDGYTSVCKECKHSYNKQDISNSKLAEFTARELIDELKLRGYKGKLEYYQRHEVVI